LGELALECGKEEQALSCYAWVSNRLSHIISSILRPIVF
jgi:hypothetical protein